MQRAERALDFLENIKESVFHMNYLADSYQDGYDRVMAALEATKEKFEDMMKRYRNDKYAYMYNGNVYILCSTM